MQTTQSTEGQGLGERNEDSELQDNSKWVVLGLDSRKKKEQWK